MNSAYLKIRNITSLEHILSYLKELENKNDVIIFFDWDDTIVSPDHNTILEPEITKELFSYMLQNKIFFSIITGRFYNTVCDDKKRDLSDIQINIQETIFPVLKQLNINTDVYLSDEHKKIVYKIYDEHKKCVGILYMGIFFSSRKGDTIKNYLRQTNIQKSKILFIDDYEPYLIETTTSLPSIEAFRRMVTYNPVIY